MLNKYRINKFFTLSLITMATITTGIGINNIKTSANARSSTIISNSKLNH